MFLINEISFWWCALIIICKLGEEAFSPWCGGIDVINQEVEDGRREKVKKSEGVDEIKLGVIKNIHKVPKIASNIWAKDGVRCERKGEECKKINNPRQNKIIEFDVFLNFSSNFWFCLFRNT